MKLHSYLWKGYNIISINLLDEKDKKTSHCTAKPSGKMWDIFSEMVEILNELQAPWILYAGSLLFYYRDCKVAYDDFDFQLELDWMTENNDELKKVLEKNNFYTKIL